MEWEYYISNMGTSAGSRIALNTELDNFGKKGWELVTVTNSELYIFKRPKG